MLGEICLDPKLSNSIDDGVPFVLDNENDNITKEFDKIVQAIKKTLDKYGAKNS